MQRNLFKILEPKTNGPEIAILLSSLLNVKISGTTLTREIEQHPDTPSLLSVSDVLRAYGIENIGIKFDKDKLSEMPVPFVTQIRGIKSESKFFTIVKEADGDIIHYYDPEKHRWDTLSRHDFVERCPGVALLTEVSDNAGEKDYWKKQAKEKRKRLQNYTVALSMPAIVMAAGVLTFIQYGAGALLPFIFSMLTLTGAIATTLLLWYELDQYNPVLQQICSAGKKVDCGAVLHSKAARIAGFSMSAIGFSYFAGLLLLSLFSLFSGISNPVTLFTLSWLNAIAVPYVVFSVYYQWQVVKQWCVLCLSVIGVLLLQLTTALVGAWHNLLPFSDISAGLIMQVITAFTIPFVMIMLLIPALQKAKQYKRTNIELQKIKHNRQIFEALLHKQKQVIKNPADLGISMGNPNALFKLIKVCNPYCGPCARAHMPLDDLLNNNPDVQLQLIFTASNKDGDITAPPVKHFLAIAEKHDAYVLKQALDDWYLADSKDYETFAAKYPMNGELKQQENKLDLMKSWCIDTEIAYTPTFFASIPGENGSTTYYRLPELYTVSDLKYFFSI